MCLCVSVCVCVCLCPCVLVSVSVYKISALWTMFTNPVCDQSHLRSLLLDVYTEETFQSLTKAKQCCPRFVQRQKSSLLCQQCKCALWGTLVTLDQYCLHILCNLLPHHTQCIGYSARDEWSWPSLGGVGGSRWYASIADKADAMSMEVQISGNMDFRIAQHWSEGPPEP